MIYLDSAATTLQKPPTVAQVSCHAMGHAASPGRGGHPWGREAARIVYDCRVAATRLFRVPNPEQVVFTFNATHALNIAIRTLVRPGMTVLISGYEHNAVTRPLHGIPDVTIRIATAPPFDVAGILDDFHRQLSRGVDCVVCCHVSNVFGFILPVEEIARLCRQFDTPLIIDAAQSAGCVPIDFTELGAQFIAAPGHKGLYGPQGTGLLLCGQNGEPLLRGGTGSLSALQEMPEELPDRLEAGTPNVPGIAGLLAGMRYVSAVGVEQIGRYERNLIRRLGHDLREVGGVRLYLADDPECQSGVLSFVVERVDCEQVGEWMGAHGVALRAGLHCAPTAHISAGTLDTGTVRASVSHFNTPGEMTRAAAVLKGMRQRL